MPFNIGPTELIIILVIALLVLGPGKLPEVGSALGKGIREFRKAASDVKDEVSLEPTVTAAPSQPPAPVPAAPVPAAPVSATPPAVTTPDAAPEARDESGTQPGPPAS